MNELASFRRFRAAARLSILVAAVACSGGSDPVSPPVSIAVSPGTASVNAGGTQVFTASLSNAGNSGVTWAASGGTVQANGTSATWTAPSSGGPYTITATSVQDPSKSASATATVKAVTIAVSPTPVTVAAGGTQVFTATVANAVNGAVTWTTSGGTIAGNGATATWTAPVIGGNYTVTATSVADATKSATATVTVTPVTMSIDPATATVGAGASRTLTATIGGGADNAITWTATGGAITGTGTTITWTAPIAGGSYEVTATSVLDNSVKATSQLTVTPIAVSIAPGSTALFRGEARAFTATVSGTSTALSGVEWSATCGTATPSGNSLAYVAPNTGGPCTITATSSADPSKSASVTVTLRSEALVTATDDSNDGVCNFAHCTLREAIVATNATPAADVILLSAASVPPQSLRASSLNARVEGAITLASSLPDITSPITIAGPGAALVAIDAAASVESQRRVFTVTGGSLTLSGLTVRGGRASFAGGILVQNGGQLTLQSVVVANNQALSGNGGGIRAVGGSNVQLQNSIIENNSAQTLSGNGAGISVESSTLVMSGGQIRNNTAGGSFGGGAFITSATGSFTNVTITGNTGDAGGGLAGWVSATVNVTGGSITGNTAAWGAGVIMGSSNTQSSTVTTIAFSNVLVADNDALSQGGGFQLTRNVQGTIDNVTVRTNRVTGMRPGFPSIAGGMYLGGAVTVTVNASTIANNSMLGITGFTEDGGGGIAIGEGAPSNPIISNSTISGNTSASFGGGIHLHLGGVTVVNSTLSGNSAFSGGAVHLRRPATLRNVSIVGNSASSTGGGITSATNGSASLASVLLSGNRVGTNPSNCYSGGGGYSSTGFNLSDDATCTILVAANDKNNTVAGVSPTLAANGGPTFTHALLAGSAAINAGNPATCPATDQRGVSRVGLCDIGAYEFVPPGQSLGALRMPASARVVGASRLVKAMAMDATTTFTGLGAGAKPQGTR